MKAKTIQIFLEGTKGKIVLLLSGLAMKDLMLHPHV